VSSLCRGGFFTRGEPDARAAAAADNRAAVAEAAELEADVLVLVCGRLIPGSRDLGLTRRMVTDAVAELVPVAQRLGVRLGVEALHPMFCADRCVLSRLGDAIDLALLFPAEAVGVVVDAYHVWWDSQLAAEIAATPRSRSSARRSGTRPPTAPLPRSGSGSASSSAGCPGPRPDRPAFSRCPPRAAGGSRSGCGRAAPGMSSPAPEP
jgi:hypothetical protein